MQPLAVDAALLRAALTPELSLSVGRELMVRVATLDASGHGTLSLAGMLIEAELPLDVRAGDELRLAVRELTPTRVVLAIQEDAAQPPAIPLLTEPPRIPMPAGGSVRVTERDARGQPGREGTHTVSLRYDAPSLGAIDMTFTLGATGLLLALTVPLGDAHTLTGAAAPELQDALRAAAERPVQITISPRREPIEVYA